MHVNLMKVLTGTDIDKHDCLPSQESPAQHGADDVHGGEEAAVGLPARQPPAGGVAIALQQPDLLAVRRLQQVGCRFRSDDQEIANYEYEKAILVGTYLPFLLARSNL